MHLKLKIGILLIFRTGDLNIENTNIKTATGVTLDENQKTLVGCILDVSYILGFFAAELIIVKLFAGRPSLKKLQLWADDGVFEDPITIATGRKQYEPQWVRSIILYFIHIALD